MIKIRYKQDFTKFKIIPHENVLSWRSKTKDEYLPIIEISSCALFFLWWSSLWTKIYFTLTDRLYEEWSYEFFRILKKKRSFSV